MNWWVILAFVLSIIIWIACMFLFQLLTSLVYHSALGAVQNLEKHAFDKGLSDYENGNYLGALPFLKQSLQSDPKNAFILTDIGSTLSAIENYSQGLSFYKKALSIEPHHKGAFLGIAEILNAMGDNKSLSLNYFRQSLVEPCTITKITCNEEDATALTHMGHFIRVLSVINQVLQFRTTSIEALNDKGEILLYLHDYTGALNIFNRLLITHPNLDSVLVNKGIAFVGLGHYKEALRLFNKSISLNPKDADTWYNIGYLYDKIGNFTGALKAYIHAQNLTPHNKDVLWNEGLTLGIVSYQYRNYSDAIKVYDAMLKIEPHNPYLLEMRNLNLNWVKGLQSESWTPGHPTNYTAARDYFGKIIVITPKDSEALNNEGLALSHVGDRSAIKFFNRSLALDPSDYTTAWNLAYTLLMFHDYKEAAPAFVKVLQLNKTDSAANDDLGIVLLSLGNHTAIKYFNKAIALNHTDSKAYYNLGEALQTWGDFKGAFLHMKNRYRLTLMIKTPVITLQLLNPNY